MNIKEITQAYLDALREANLNAVVDLFANKGVVISPIYGTMDARSFYKTLFSDTQNSTLTLLGIFQDVDDTTKMAIHFTYQWTMVNGSIVSFDVVDVIKLNEQNKITELTIIYDTQDSRPAVSQLRP